MYQASEVTITQINWRVFLINASFDLGLWEQKLSKKWKTHNFFAQIYEAHFCGF